MARQFSSDTNTEKDKDQANDILTFVDIFLDNETLHFVNSDEDVAFFDYPGGSPQEYKALAMTREKIEQSIDIEINTLSAGLDNVDRAMSYKIASKEFRDKRILIRGCFRNLIAEAANAWVQFDGKIDNPVLTEHEFQIELVPRLGQGTLNTQVGVLQQLLCNWPFAGAECAYGTSAALLKDEKTAQTVDSGTTAYIVDSARTEADDYWNFGILEFASDTVTVALRGVKRRIKDFVAAEDKVYFTIALSVAPQAGDTYSLERGCDKTLASCQNKFSNDINFFGIHTLPAMMVRK